MTSAKFLDFWTTPLCHIHKSADCVPFVCFWVRLSPHPMWICHMRMVPKLNSGHTQNRCLSVCLSVCSLSLSPSVSVAFLFTMPSHHYSCHSSREGRKRARARALLAESGGQKAKQQKKEGGLENTGTYRAGKLYFESMNDVFDDLKLQKLDWVIIQNPW